MLGIADLDRESRRHALRVMQKMRDQTVPDAFLDEPANAKFIAADMLAQNPGLGKFVWDTFQNGSSESMAQIVVAVFTIGIIGFFLDRLMFVLQKLVTFEQQAI